jgi:hypothetical protein
LIQHAGRQQIVAHVRVQEALVKERARRNDTDDVALESATGEVCTWKLLVKRDAAPMGLHERLQMPVEVHDWEAGHVHARAAPDTRRKLDAEQSRELRGLVKVGLQEVSSGVAIVKTSQPRKTDRRA